MNKEDLPHPLLPSHQQRLKVINLLRSYTNRKKSGITKRLRSLKLWNAINLITMALIWSFILFITARDFFAVPYLKYDWNNAGLLSVLAVSFTLRMTPLYFEQYLISQIVRLNRTNIEIEESNNRELLQIIDNINRPWRKIHIIILSIVVIIAGSWQILENNTPFWEYVKIPLLLLFVSALVDFFLNMNKLRQNFQKIPVGVAL